MAIALVQNGSSFTPISSTNLTLPGPSTAGNLLVAHLNGFTVTPPAGWTLAINATQDKLYYYENNPGGLSSFNFGSVGGVISEWSGVATTSSLDTSGMNNTATSSPVTVTTTGNVAAANELAVGVIVSLESKSGTSTMGAGSGWTSLGDSGAVSTTTHGIGSYQLNPTSGTTLSEVGSSSSMNITNMYGAIAVFKPAPVSTAPVGKFVSDIQNNAGLSVSISPTRASYY